MIGNIFSILFTIFLLIAGLILSMCLFIGAKRDNEFVLYFLAVGVLLFTLMVFFNILGI